MPVRQRLVAPQYRQGSSPAPIRTSSGVFAAAFAAPLATTVPLSARSRQVRHVATESSQVAGRDRMRIELLIRHQRPTLSEQAALLEQVVGAGNRWSAVRIGNHPVGGELQRSACLQPPAVGAWRSCVHFRSITPSPPVVCLDEQVKPSLDLQPSANTASRLASVATTARFFRRSHRRGARPHPGCDWSLGQLAACSGCSKGAAMADELVERRSDRMLDSHRLHHGARLQHRCTMAWASVPSSCSGDGISANRPLLSAARRRAASGDDTPPNVRSLSRSLRAAPGDQPRLRVGSSARRPAAAARSPPGDGRGRVPPARSPHVPGGFRRASAPGYRQDGEEGQVGASGDGSPFLLPPRAPGRPGSAARRPSAPRWRCPS